MKKLFIITLLLTSIGIARAQTTNNPQTEHDAAVKAKDDAVKKDIIYPAKETACGEAPDWAALTKTIMQKYDTTTADRTITKARIYFYYGQDWPTFCAAIVNYTSKYELASDFKLLDKNAAMILKNSDDPAQLKEALRWSKAAPDSDPQNETYKATYDGLTAKIKGN